MRQTREVTISVNGEDIKVELNSFLTGFEKQEMLRIMSNGTIMQDGVPVVNGDSAMKGQDYLIRTLVVSINGNKNDPYNALMNMHQDAYDAVVLEINSEMASWGKKKVQ